MWWGRRNPLGELDDLPDMPRLGVILIIAGVTLEGVRYGWPRVAPASFQWASVVFFHFSRYFLRYASQQSLSDLLLVFEVGFVLVGTFIFFRRGVWWWQDRRDGKSTTRLRFK